MNASSDKGRRPFIFRTASRCTVVAAFALIVLGYILMAGPGSTAQSFNPDIFAARRIVVAPILCLAGYLLLIVAILRR